MIRLSERTLQGMRRAYEETLDAYAYLYALQKANTATGRSSSYVRYVGSDSLALAAVPIRIDPDVVDEQYKTMTIEKGGQCFVSLPVSAPILEKGDRVALLDSLNAEDQVYEIKGSPEKRSGETFDRKYRAVRVA